MGALIGLIAGIGLLLIWRSGSRAPQRSARAVRWTTRQNELLRLAGLNGVSYGQLLALQGLLAIAAFVVVTLLTRTASVAGCFAVFSFFGPHVLVRRRRARRMAALREAWPEAIDNLASAVRAGLSLPEALAGLAERGPQTLRAAFDRFALAYRVSGRFDAALDSLKLDLADPVADRVCETMRVARVVGGSDLGSVLRALSEMLREDARTRSELETRQGWTVNAARLALASPWLVLLLLGSQSSSLESFDSGSGLLLLLVGAAVCAIAYRLMMRLSRLPDVPRVLR